MPENTYHQSLRLENFTVFKDAAFEFVPGVNVFIGENGTGKTHLMKAMYAMQRVQSRRNKNIDDTLSELFQTSDISEIVRLGRVKGAIAKVSGRYNNREWAYAIQRTTRTATTTETEFPSAERPIFIPAIDMMGHTKGFLAASNEIVLDFDLTCNDIVAQLGLQRRNGSSPPPVPEGLSELLGGEIEYDEGNSRFYLITALGRLPMPLVAEGLRKIATLVRLAQNGWLTPGTTLFWDEPEANMNPVLMDNIIKAALILARQGIQIFLTTHSYVILKELDLQATPQDTVRYFSLQNPKSGTSGTKVTTAETLAALDPNPILRQYASLYNRDLDRALGKGRRHGAM
jgi:AAA15 family ATPase/GTPase